MTEEQNIKFNLIVEAQEAIKNGKLLRDSVKEVGEQLIELRKISELTFDELAVGMKEAYAKEKIEKVKLTPDFELQTGAEAKELIKSAEEDIKRYGQLVNRAAKSVENAYKQQDAAIKRSARERVKELKALEKEAANERKKVIAEQKTQATWNEKAYKQEIALAKEKARAVIAEHRKEAKAAREAARAGIDDRKEVAELAKKQAVAATEAYKAAFKEQITATKAAIEAAREYGNTQTQTSKNAVDAASKQQIAAKMTSDGLKQVATDAEREANALEKAARRGIKSTDKLSAAFSGLAKAAKFAFVTVIGGSAVVAVRRLFRALGDLTEKAMQFQKAQFTLALGMREMQRRGQEVSFADVEKKIDSLYDKFDGLFSRRELTVSIAGLMNRLARLSFSIENVGSVLDTAIILKMNDVENRFNSVEDAARVLGTYLASGYGEGVERAGLLAGRAADKFIEFELGIENLRERLTPTELAQARLNFVIAQTSGQLEDVTAWLETYTAEIEKARSAVDDATTEMGTRLLGLRSIWERFIGFAAQRLADALYFILRVQAEAYSVILTVVQTTSHVMKEGFDDITEYATKAYDQIRGKLLELYGITQQEAEWPMPPDYEALISGRGAEDAFKEIFKEVLKLQQEYEDDVLDAEREFGDDWEEIDEDIAEKLIDIWEKYYEKLEDIEEKTREQLEDALTKYNRSIEDANEDLREKIQDAQEKYRENELKAERDFQQKLKNLRDKFLFDLEDAVRDRDARQIMRLQRRYSMDRQKIIDDYEQDSIERKKALDDELKDIRKQHERKLADLKKDYQRRQAEIAKQEARSREDAKKARERAQDDLDDSLKEKRESLQESYDEELKSLQDNLQARVEETAARMLEEYGVTKKESERIAQQLDIVFGPGGRVESTYEYMGAMIEQAVNDAMTSLEELKDILDEIQHLPWPSDYVPPDYMPWKDDTDDDGVSNFGAGGSLLATSPTRALFGEAGPELVTFTPLSNLNVNNLGARPAISPGGSVRVEVLLSPDLEGRIVSNTLGEMADVVSILRSL